MAAPATTATTAASTNGSPKRHAGRTRPRYAPEFKAEAIALVRRVTAGGAGGGGSGGGGSSGAGRTAPLTRVAHDLGVSVETLRAWVKQDDIDGGRRDGLTTEEREELRQLRRENRLLKMEREVLKNFRARRHLLLNGETPVGYRRAAREEWPSAYWCV